MGGSLADLTWGEFLQGLQAANVEMAETESGGKYVIRYSDGRVLWASLPMSFELSEPVGIWVFECTCRRLEVNPSTYFKGWYLPL